MLMPKEKQQLLMRLLQDLSENERMAIILFEVEGYSGQEIAEIQEVPLDTVWTCLYKARQRLSQKLLRLEEQGRRGTSR